ncbi:MAG: AmmeMemoRadiSam system protein B, partial [Chlorobi bacterium]|nr:AmmeMemoRadiSam system protein B [Chlorobiota bacterium]
MNKIKIFGMALLLSWLSDSTAYPQAEVDRQPYAAGKFYTADSSKLSEELHVLFSKAKNQKLQHVLALISPHAGYAYSGEVAATAFEQLPPDSQYDNIFLIGSSHTMYLDGASVYSAGNYLTPLGEVPVNTVLAKQLIKENKYISFIPQAHSREHSLENQLPFLQYHLKKPFRIVPIIIGTDDENKLKSIAATLKPYLNDKNLFVISSDFSHYPRYYDARKADSATAEGILTNDPEKFKEALLQNSKKQYPGLVTSACGHTSILTLLYMTYDMPGVKYVPLKYMNSGDSPYGDKSRVVGYFSIALVGKQDQDSHDFLTLQDKKELLLIARETLEDYINTKQIPDIDPATLSDNLKVHSGAFVTLNKDGSLRGCIGRFIADEPLYKVVQQMTIAA